MARGGGWQASRIAQCICGRYFDRSGVCRAVHFFSQCHGGACLVSTLMRPFSGGLFNSGLFRKDSETVPPTPVIPEKWEITIQTNGANQRCSFSVLGDGVDIHADWGDGSVEHFTTTGAKTHIYANAGIFTIRVWGSFLDNGLIKLGIYSPDRTYITSIGAMCYFPGLKLTTQMFSGCYSITSLPDDLFRFNPQITQFNATFYSCAGLSGSDVPSDLFKYAVNNTTFSSVFYGITFNTESYSNLLISMNDNLPQSGLQFHGGNSKYNASGATARAALVARGWTITDGGPA